MKKFLLCLSLLLSSYSYALVYGKVEVHGKVVSYNKKTVTLQQKTGKKIKVPRQAVQTKKIRTRQKVHALLKIEDLKKKSKVKQTRRMPASSEYGH